MFDPYSVLGINRGASDEEIKKAYRAMSRKYHPDANVNNPNKEQAEEKFKEVQQAYQQIMDEKEYGGSSGTGYGNFGGFGGFGQNRQNSNSSDDEYTMHMRAAMNYIQTGHYQEALNVLNNISQKSAEWYCMSALANSGAGNNIVAIEHARQAVAMEPGNQQYRMILQQLESGGTWYRTGQNPYGNTMDMGDGACCRLCMANLLCNLCFC